MFPLSLVQEAGDNGTEKLLITLDHVSCTNYFMSIEISWCVIRLIKIAKPDKKNMWQNTLYLLNMTQQLHVAELPQATEDGLVWYRECKQVVRTSSWGSILRVSHLSHHTRTHHISFISKMKQCKCACVMAIRRSSAHADVDQNNGGTLKARKPSDPLSSWHT